MAQRTVVWLLPAMAVVAAAVRWRRRMRNARSRVLHHIT